MPRSKLPSVIVPPSPEPEQTQSYEEIFELTVKRPLVKERSFPLTPTNHPFVHQITESGLTGLIRKRTRGNLAFVHRFYAFCRHQSTLRIDFRGLAQPHLIDRHTIRHHFSLPHTESDPYTQFLISDYPTDDIAETLCLPGMSWHIPRRTEKYIRRAECRPETKPYVHLVCSSILPTSHLANLTKRQALCIYLLMQGIRFDISSVIYTSLRDAVLTPKSTKAIILPHLISDLFTALAIPSHPEDQMFTPTPTFTYERIRAAPPPRPEPIPDIADPGTDEEDSEEPAPETSGDHPDVPAPITLESLSADFRQFRAAFERERRYRHRMDALIAQHLHFQLPSEGETDSGADTSGAGPSGEGGATGDTGGDDDDDDATATDVDSAGDSAMQGGD